MRSTKKEKALKLFDGGYNCAQSVFAAFAPESGISVDESLRIATAFGGGMGKQQLVCGAVTGALMALGSIRGKGLDDPEMKKQEVYLLTRDFCQAFMSKHGSLHCRELLNGLNMLDQEENRKIKELGLTETHCTRYVADAVEIMEKLLEVGISVQP